MAASSTNRWAVALDTNAVLGEGPVWNAYSERLLWVDIDAGAVHETKVGSRFGPENAERAMNRVHSFGKPVSSVIPTADRGCVVGVTDGVAFLDSEFKEMSRLVIGPTSSSSRMNDAKADPRGRLFTGTMTPTGSTSALYRVDRDRTWTVVFDGVGISNGLAWSPDSTSLYYIDTPTLQIDVADYDVATGEVENRRCLTTAPAEGGFPDGMTIDSEGCLWVAFWDGACIRRFDPDGALMDTVELPVQRPTSCAFGGDEFDRLFVTSASTGLGPTPGRPLIDGALLEVDVDAVGIAPTLVDIGPGSS